MRFKRQKSKKEDEVITTEACEQEYAESGPATTSANDNSNSDHKNKKDRSGDITSDRKNDEVATKNKHKEFSAKPSGRINTSDISSDNDVWAEYLAVVEILIPGQAANLKNTEPRYELEIRSFFESALTGKRTWDEPPTGATTIQYASDTARKMAEAQKAELQVVTRSVEEINNSRDSLDEATNPNNNSNDGSSSGSPTQQKSKITSRKQLKKGVSSILKKMSLRNLKSSSQPATRRAAPKLEYIEGGAMSHITSGQQRDTQYRQDLALAKRLSKTQESGGFSASRQEEENNASYDRNLRASAGHVSTYDDTTNFSRQAEASLSASGQLDPVPSRNMHDTRNRDLTNRVSRDEQNEIDVAKALSLSLCEVNQAEVLEMTTMEDYPNICDPGLEEEKILEDVMRASLRDVKVDEDVIEIKSFDDKEIEADREYGKCTSNVDVCDPELEEKQILENVLKASLQDLKVDEDVFADKESCDNIKAEVERIYVQADLQKGKQPKDEDQALIDVLEESENNHSYSGGLGLAYGGTSVGDDCFDDEESEDENLAREVRYKGLKTP